MATDSAAALAGAAAEIPLLNVLRRAWQDVLRVIGLCALNGAGFYLLFVYSVTYLHQFLHIPTARAFDINTASMILLLITMPLSGGLSDRLGRRPVLAAASLSLVMLSWPIFRMMHHNDDALVLLAQLTFAVLLGFYLGVVPVVLAEAFPRSTRCSGFALAYNLGLAVFGGLSPVVVTYLIARTENDMIPAFAVILAAMLSMVAVVSLRETAHSSL